MPFINTRLKSKKTPYRPPECLNSPVAYTQKHPGTNRTRVSLLAAGEGFELSEGDFRQYQLILSNAAIH